MIVVVTGAAGFLGGHAVTRLLERGDEVVAVDRRPVPHDLAERVRTVLREDLTDPTGRWRVHVRRADAVLHLAARPGVRDGGEAVEGARQRDILGSTRALAEGVPDDVPLVAVSSSAAYGEAPHGRGSREDDPLRPVGSYARWKSAAEEVCARRRDRGGLVSIARPFTVAGPGQRRDMAVDRWLRAAVAGEPAQVMGGLDRARDVTDVADVVTGLVRLLDIGVHDRHAATVNLGAGRPRTHREVIESVVRVTGRPLATVIVPAHPDEVTRTHADTATAARLLGLAPSTDLDGLLERQLAALAATARR